MIVVDTNVLYAATDRSDNHHRRCAEWITSATDALLILPTVLADTCYLIDRALGATAEAAFLDDVGVGDAYPYQLVDLVDLDLRRMSELVRAYADRRLGGTDASIVAVCERLDIDAVATLNRRDFDNLRPRHRGSADHRPWLKERPAAPVTKQLQGHRWSHCSRSTTTQPACVRALRSRARTFSDPRALGAGGSCARSAR